MKTKLTLIIVLSWSTLVFTQEKLSKLIAPTSPAASILGLQPKSVLSPKSYQALETALYSNFLNSEGNTAIPNDFGIEFTPYWTKNHSLSLEDYLYPKSLFEQFIRNSSFSNASTQNYLLEDSTSTNSLAFGYRTTFYVGNKNDREEIQKYRDSLRNNQRIQIKIASMAERLINDHEITGQNDFLDKMKIIVIKAIFESGKYKSVKEAEELTNIIYRETSLLPALNLDNPDEFLDAFYNLIDQNLNAGILFNRFKDYIKDRQGLSLDIAFANLLNFPMHNFHSSSVPLQSFWITPTYRFKNQLSFLKIMGVFRYEWYNPKYFREFFPKTLTYNNNTDYGLAVSTEFKKFSFQFEAVGRNSNAEIPAGIDDQGNELFRKKQNSDFQYIGSFNYNLTDQVVLSYNLGNRFEPIQNPENTLVSLLTLNFGFGAPTKNDLTLDK